MEETDVERSRTANELRQSYLKLETVRQEKKVPQENLIGKALFCETQGENLNFLKVVELEVEFLNKVLRSKGLLPEKDTAKKEKNLRNRRSKAASVTDEAIKSQAIVIQ